MTNDPPELMLTRSSLLSRLKDWDDVEGWHEFFNTYWRLIYNSALKAGLSDAEAQDVVQDTILSVAKKMQGFEYDRALGSFKSWLLQLTHWRILNQLKKRLPAEVSTSRNDPRTSTTDRIPDPTTADITAYWDHEWQKHLVDAAIQRVKEKVSPRQYEIFYLHVAKNFPAAEVAATLNVNLAQVYLAKHRVSALVKKEVRRLEKQMI